MTKLTTHERVLKRNIEEIRKTVNEHQIILHNLQDVCGRRGHKIIPRDPDIEEKLKTDEWASTSAICAICGERLGWWCPNSPDHVCHYEGQECLECKEIVIDDKGVIKHEKKKHDKILAFRNIVGAGGCCVFCHMPQERK